MLTPPVPDSAAELDVVYTWVDGSRPFYHEHLLRYSATASELNPERFRDPAQLLRHSLRSLERFFPSFGRLFIVTARPQIPTWLNLTHPRLKVVHHDEFFDDPTALPTFNSNVIESFIHLLPGISERFLYFNDDYFLGAPITAADFIAPDGRLRVFGSFCGEYFRSRTHEQLRITFSALEHGPLLIDRTAFAAALAAAPGELAELRRHRFRQPDDLRPDRLYRWHLLRRDRGHAVAEPFWRYLRYARFLKLVDRPAALARRLGRLRAAQPKFFCLNDDLGPRPSEAALTTLKDFLSTYFPEPSSFELPRAPSPSSA